MELLRSHLAKVRIPEPTNRIHKEECCISFDTPVCISSSTLFLRLFVFWFVSDMCLIVAFYQRSDGGLYVDMCTFLGFGKDFVTWNFEKTGNPVYLHIRQERKPVPEDRPLKKPTLLAIGNDILSFVPLKIGNILKFYWCRFVLQ